jgi:hypothetical protein
MIHSYAAVSFLAPWRLTGPHSDHPSNELTCLFANPILISLFRCRAA